MPISWSISMASAFFGRCICLVYGDQFYVVYFFKADDDGAQSGLSPFTEEIGMMYHRIGTHIGDELFLYTLLLYLVAQCPCLGNIAERVGIDETYDGYITEEFYVADDRFRVVCQIAAAGCIFDTAEGTAVRTTESGRDKAKTEAEVLQQVRIAIFADKIITGALSSTRSSRNRRGGKSKLRSGFRLRDTVDNINRATLFHG